MAFERRWPLGSGVRVALAGSLIAGVALAQEEGPRQLLSSYPSSETLVVPRNAQFFAIGEYDAGRPLMSLDDSNELLESVGETGAHRLRFAPADPLSPGPHRLLIGVGRDDVELAFEVEDAFGPDSDDVASVRVTRAVRFVFAESYALSEGYRREIEALMADPSDCSRLVVQQLFPQDDQTPGRAGEYRLELEAEGPVLGFIVDGSIVLPGACRGAFLPSLGKHPGVQPGSGSQPGFEAGFEAEPLLVQVLTATGRRHDAGVRGQHRGLHPGRGRLAAWR